MNVFVNLLEAPEDWREELMRLVAAGLHWKLWEAQPIADQIKLHGCTGLPAPLPRWMRREFYLKARVFVTADGQGTEARVVDDFATGPGVLIEAGETFVCSGAEAHEVCTAAVAFRHRQQIREDMFRDWCPPWQPVKDGDPCPAACLICNAPWFAGKVTAMHTRERGWVNFHPPEKGETT